MKTVRQITRTQVMTTMLIVAGVFFSGCTGFAQLNKPQQQLIDQHYRFSKISLTTTAEGARSIKKYKLIKLDQLNKTLYRIFRKENLIDKHSRYSLELQITEVRSRSNLVAIVLPVSWSDHIYANSLVRNQRQKIVEKFAIKARYSLGGTLSGYSGIRLRLLYYNFAKTVANTFTGKDDNKED